MSPLLIGLLGVLLVPLFVGTWRASLVGLSIQGLLMAWIAYRLGPAPATAGEWLVLGDFVLVRGLGTPVAFYIVLRGQNAVARNDVIPPNLLSWGLALGIVLVAFDFSASLVPEAGQQQTLVAVALAGFLLGFLVLATQAGQFSQMVGALRIENAIALFELGGERHHPPIGVQVGVVAVFVITVALFRGYLKTLDSTTTSPAERAADEPTL